MSKDDKSGSLGGVTLDINGNIEMSESTTSETSSTQIMDAVASPENESESLSHLPEPSTIAKLPPLPPPKPVRQVDFALDGESRPSSADKICRSGSMFVHISNTAVDQERMEDFEKNTKTEANSNQNHDTVQKDEMQRENVEKMSLEKEPEVEKIQPEPTSPSKPETLKQNEVKAAAAAAAGGGSKGSSGGGGDPKKNPPNLTKGPKPGAPKGGGGGGGGNTAKPRHLLTVEVQGRKVPPLRDLSPYACKIVEIPQDFGKSNKKKVVSICQKDHKILEQELDGHEKQKLEEEAIEASAKNWLAANPLFALKQEQHKSRPHPLPTSTTTLPFLARTDSIPLKMWPNFKTLQKTVESQTLLAFGSNIELPAAATGQIVGGGGGGGGSWLFNSCQTPNPTPDVDASIPNIGSNSNTSDAATDENAAALLLHQKLEEFGDYVERGVFSAAEVCNVLLHTIFRDSLGSPASLERVLESQDFLAFIQSPNEVTALEVGAEILSAASSLISAYLEVVQSSGLELAGSSQTLFAKRSAAVLSVTSPKKNMTLAQLQAQFGPHSHPSRVWSFVPASHPNKEKYQLALFLNSETGQVMQTISCEDHIFRTRYSMTPLEARIQGVLSSSREQVGLPSSVPPEFLVDIVAQCSALAYQRLSRGRLLISQSNSLLGKYFKKFTKAKYNINIKTKTGTPRKLWPKLKLKGLEKLQKRLQQLNIFTGIVNQMATEVAEALRKLQLYSSFNDLFVQDTIKLGGAFSTGVVKPKTTTTTSTTPTPTPVQEAMTQLAGGIRSIDSALRVGEVSLATLRLGVRLEKKDKEVVKLMLEGVRALGTENELDYGTLLMTLLCSSELMAEARFKEGEEAKASLSEAMSKGVRSGISFHLVKLNLETGELLKIVERMGADSKILTMRTTFKMRELKNRFGGGVKK